MENFGPYVLLFVIILVIIMLIKAVLEHDRAVKRHMQLKEYAEKKLDAIKILPNEQVPKGYKFLGYDENSAYKLYVPE